MSDYRIREVDTDEEDAAEIVLDLHRATFPGVALPDLNVGLWWVASDEVGPVGFAGLTPSTAGTRIGYLKRAGVLASHTGKGLQRRFIRVREAAARRLGWKTLLTDTTDNPASANNLARCGYKMFTPAEPWALKNSLYWWKRL